MTLPLYLMRVIGLRILAVCLVLLTIGIGVDLIRTAPDLIEFGGGSAVAKYAVLRSPAILATTLPIAVLIGTLLTMLALGQSSELPIMRSAGISTGRMLVWLTPLAVLMGGIHYLTVDRGVIWSDNALGAAFGEIAGADVPGIGRVIAVRDGERILYGRLAKPDGNALAPLVSISLNKAGNIIMRDSAESASYENGVWTLTSVTRVRIGGGESVETTLPELRLTSALTPQLVLDLAGGTKAVDSHHAAAVLAKEAIATRGSAYYAMQIRRSYVAWTVPFIMLLIGMLGSYKLPRSARGLYAAAGGFIIGIFYIGTEGLFTSFGRLGILPVDFAALTPSFSFTLITIIAMRQLES